MIDLHEEQLSLKLRSVYVLQGAQIDFYWDQIRDAFGEVPQFYDFYTPEWVYEQVKMGHYQIWALSDGTIRGIVLTQLLVFPKQNVMEILAGFGVDLLDFFDECLELFLRFARQNGCDTLTARCRPGLARKLKRLHPKNEYITLSFPVPEIGESS